MIDRAAVFTLLTGFIGTVVLGLLSTFIAVGGFKGITKYLARCQVEELEALEENLRLVFESSRARAYRCIP